MSLRLPNCRRCGKEKEAGPGFCKNCGFDAEANMMMPLFVASASRRRLVWLAAAWLLAVGVVLLYTLERDAAFETLALVVIALAIGTSAFGLRQRAPYSYAFFEEFVRVTYPSSLSRVTTGRIPYSTITDFAVVHEGKATRYQFSVSGREGRFVVRDVTSYAGMDLSRWIEGRLSVPVKQDGKN